MVPNKDNDNSLNNSESQNDDVFSRQPDNDHDIPQDAHGGLETDEGTVEGYYSSDDDKYLALEQPGVSYTDEGNTTLLNSDDIEDGTPENEDLWDPEVKNTRNSEAFNQDKYILNENIDLDEDSHRSISSDDNLEDINTNNT